MQVLWVCRYGPGDDCCWRHSLSGCLIPGAGAQHTRREAGRWRVCGAKHGGRGGKEGRRTVGNSKGRSGRGGVGGFETAELEWFQGARGPRGSLALWCLSPGGDACRFQMSGGWGWEHPVKEVVGVINLFGMVGLHLKRPFTWSWEIPPGSARPQMSKHQKTGNRRHGEYTALGPRALTEKGHGAHRNSRDT